MTLTSFQAVGPGEWWFRRIGYVQQGFLNPRTGESEYAGTQLTQLTVSLCPSACSLPGLQHPTGRRIQRWFNRGSKEDQHATCFDCLAGAGLVALRASRALENPSLSSHKLQANAGTPQGGLFILFAVGSVAQGLSDLEPAVAPVAAAAGRCFVCAGGMWQLQRQQSLKEACFDRNGLEALQTQQVVDCSAREVWSPVRTQPQQANADFKLQEQQITAVSADGEPDTG